MLYNLYPSSQVHLPEKIDRLLRAVTKGRADTTMALPVLLGVVSTLGQGKFELEIQTGLRTKLPTVNFVVADSSEGKGPIFSDLTEPIEAIVEAENRRIAFENQQATIINKALDDVIRGIRKKLEKAPKALHEALLHQLYETELQKIKIKPRIVFSTQDVTGAGLVKLLKSQPGQRVGILDQEGRFLRSLLEERFIQAFINSAYDGETSNNCRASVDSTNGLHPLISVVCMIQPEKLKLLTRHPELWAEGLFPRASVYFPASCAGTRPVVGVNSDADIIEWYRARVAELFHFPWCDAGNGERHLPHVLTLSDDAYEIWYSAAQWFETAQLPWQPYSHLKCWLGKAAMRVARHAALLHLLDCVTNLVRTPINGFHMQCAVGVTMAQLPYVDRLYRLIYPNPVSHLAKKVYTWLSSLMGTQGYVTLRDIYRATHMPQELASQVVVFFVNQGVLKPTFLWEGCNSSPNYGRPKSAGYEINFSALHALNYNNL